MAFTTSTAFALRGFVNSEPTAKPVQKARRGFFARLLAAMQAARMRQAEREIAHYLAFCGGKITDETEREIERRFISTTRG